MDEKKTKTFKSNASKRSSINVKESVFYSCIVHFGRNDQMENGHFALDKIYRLR